ncbi:MAG: DUF4115 domain-containing protein [Bryobacteraceae bacterium]|nr:DUF4115 domain-containing protein [Bryobacteraceae bacterium]
MPSIGHKLRQERERLGIPLADIARETRISARYLEAIETEDTRTLPQDFFYRSFVRQYAEYLGISADEVTTTLRRELPPEPVQEIVPAAPAKVIPSLAPTLAPPSEPAPFPVSFDDGRTSKRWLAVAALLLVGSVSYLATRRPGVSEPAAPTTEAVSQPSTQAPSVNVSTPPPASTTQLGTAVVQATNLGSGRLQIVISAREQTWIKLVADGKNIYMGLIEPGQSQAIENASNAELLTGNAGGIEVKQNGRPLPGLGSSGEVRTVVFDTENYQVRQPAPKPKAPEPAPVSSEPAKTTSST